MDDKKVFVPFGSPQHAKNLQAARPERQRTFQESRNREKERPQGIAQRARNQGFNFPASLKQN